MPLAKNISPYDNSDFFLLATNIGTIGLALGLGWSIMTILWGYWVQSVIIGFYTAIKLIVLGQRIENKANSLEGLGLALFFVLHYGLFHFAYLVFLTVFTIGLFSETQVSIDITGIGILGIVFLINHGFSMWYNTLRVKKIVTEKDLQQEFIAPYPRIIPMHLTIIFVGIFIIESSGTAAIIIFMGIKTIADFFGHKWLHSKKFLKKSDFDKMFGGRA